MKYARVMSYVTGPKNPTLGDLWISPNSGNTYYWNGVHWSQRGVK